MNISIISVFPALYEPFLQTSLIRRAQEKNIVAIHVSNLFSFVEPRQRIDAPVVGPGTGMLIRPEIIERAIDSCEKHRGASYKIFFSPQGKKLNQKRLRELMKIFQEKRHIMLIPARYEGMDARVEEEYADELFSIGDYVLMGGDLPAMVLLEGLLRLAPGVVGKEESVQQESFTGPFVDYPEYTLPVCWKGKKIPEIVQSGHHKQIARWRLRQSVKKSVMNHFQWVRSHELSDQEKVLIKDAIPPHYVALMHTDVLVGRESKQAGNTSVTSIDIHDIARSSCTYAVDTFFIVTPLLDQQRIVQTFLEFWQEGHGIQYNPNRFQAIDHVLIADSLKDVISTIEAKEGKPPLVVATSARTEVGNTSLGYYEQQRVWAYDRPVLLLFGTGQGLAEYVLKQADFVLDSIQGFTEFNHLSVRSAAAIILDRWLGIYKNS